MKDKEKVSIYNKSYYQRNKEKYKAYYRKNKTVRLTYSHTYYQDNKEVRLAYTEAYRQAHQEEMKAYSQAYNKTNKSKKNAHTRNRQAAKLQRTPGWLTEEQLQQIKDFYINCPVGMTVDHIIPLRGKFVSGLHHPDNLQYLTPEENSSKGNRYPAATEKETHE
ncbi:hypothetical protein LCGC14_0940720 [marine sediment metagenome]|uniref:HNH nuclease domain-containing protein n=1 Tax=marine sediment metagenome TaxID=412755 RepID=A0A0F9RRI3_9ZZZZ